MASLARIGLGFMEKDKDKDKSRESPLERQAPPQPLGYEHALYTFKQQTSTRPFPSIPAAGASVKATADASSAFRPSPTQRRLHRVKARRSLTGLYAAPPAEASVVSSAPTLQSSATLTDAPAKRTKNQTAATFGHGSDAAFEDDERFTYTAKNTWMRRGNMKLHPYPEEAPYMLAYNRMLLENDRYTDLLLTRLNRLDSPSFHNYAKTPPASVLDLGCGQGCWILYAARTWRNSVITGLDMIDVTFQDVKTAPNVRFVRGNFLTHALPFPDKSFDLVRMSNLSLCIPYEKWEYVFSEVRRVLQLGGRLELVDDQILFPYERVSPVIPSPLPDPSASTFDDDALLDEANERASSVSAASTIISSSPANSTSSCEKPPSSATTCSLPPSCPISSTDTSSVISRVTSNGRLSNKSRFSMWEKQVSTCRDIEMIFQNMLFHKHQIHLRPSEFVFDLLRLIFGKRNVKKMKTYHVRLAPPDAPNRSLDASQYSLNGKVTVVKGDQNKMGRTGSDPILDVYSATKKALANRDRDKQIKKSMKLVRKAMKEAKFSPEKDFCIGPSSEGGISKAVVISAKAAERLGIPSTLINTVNPASSTASRLPKAGVMPRAVQSPGLYVWPSTFIPLSPMELEMHACKHIHMLLGCKYTLQQYVETHTDDDGQKLVSGDEFVHALWSYECFRRQRFNWPSDVFLEDHQIYGQDQGASSLGEGRFHLSDPPSTSRISWDSSPYDCNDLAHVRTIRVYEAIKTDEESLGSLLFPRPTIPKTSRR